MSEQFAEPVPDRRRGFRHRTEHGGSRWRLPRPGRKSGIVTVIVAVCIAGASVAFASIPDSNGVIHGCYNVSNKFVRVGTVRIVNAASDCASSEKAITWSQTGPTGPPGPAVVHANFDMGAPIPNCTPPNCNLVALFAGGAAQSVEQITIPADGTYLLTDKVDLQNENPADSNNVGCEIKINGSVVDSAGALITGSGDSAALPLQDTTFAAAGSTDELVCVNDGTDAPVAAFWIHLSAIRVGP